MKAAPFAYVRPTSVADAISALVSSDGDAKVLAGGQNLVPMLNMRLVAPRVVVDIGAIDGLDAIRFDGGLEVGATARYARVEQSPVVRRHAPLLAEGIRLVGDPLVRNRGTIGGSLAQGDPSGEMPMVALALDATVHAKGPAGVRAIPAREFFVGPYQTALEPDELVVSVTYPDAAGTVCAFGEQTRRHNDYAVVAVAAVGEPRPDGAWAWIRLALGAVADRVLLAEEAGALLEGARLDDATVRAAADVCAAIVDPPSDARASAEYRRHMLPIYVERTLARLEARRAATTPGGRS